MVKKKNAFSFFLDRYVDGQRRKGRIISNRLAAEECSGLWKELPSKEKQIFIDLAKGFKNEQEYRNQKTNNQSNDSLFQSINVLDEEKSGNVLSYLNAHITHEKALRKHNFYIIHCNYYCRTEEGLYLPAEIALSQFNLEHGIRQTYHTLINPGKIPLGYAYEVRRVIDEVHGLPIPPHCEGESNLKQIITEIVHFVESSREEEDEDEYPPLFTIQENVQASSEILKQLQSKLKVYSIHTMFFWLKNKCTECCGNKPGFPVLSNAITEIEKDVYRYCTGLSCKYHSDLPGKFQTCSLSIVKRLVFIICDHCCRHLQIKLSWGKHVPENFRKRRSDSSQKAISSDISEYSVGYEESNFSGASTYASSFVGDNAYESVERSCSEERLYRLQVDIDNTDDLCLVRIRGRGRHIGNVEREVGLPRF